MLRPPASRTARQPHPVCRLGARYAAYLGWPRESSPASPRRRELAGHSAPGGAAGRAAGRARALARRGLGRRARSTWSGATTARPTRPRRCRCWSRGCVRSAGPTWSCGTATATGSGSGTTRSTRCCSAGCCERGAARLAAGDPGGGGHARRRGARPAAADDDELAEGPLAEMRARARRTAHDARRLLGLALARSGREREALEHLRAVTPERLRATPRSSRRCCARRPGLGVPVALEHYEAYRSATCATGSAWTPRTPCSGCTASCSPPTTRCARECGTTPRSCSAARPTSRGCAPPCAPAG